MQNLFRRLLFQYWYFRRPPWDTGVSPPELFEFIEKHEPGSAIDIGCGTGTNVITLARAGWQVTGVDFAPRAIRIARKKVRQEGIQAKLLIKDATHLNGVHGPFDLALDLGCFHGIQQDRRAKYLEELCRILPSSGYWLMYGFLKTDANHAGTRLTETDLDQIAARLTLLSRRDGLDDGRAKPSAWFLFQKQI